jgi:hypothetical protein
VGVAQAERSPQIGQVRQSREITRVARWVKKAATRNPWLVTR